MLSPFRATTILILCISSLGQLHSLLSLIVADTSFHETDQVIFSEAYFSRFFFLEKIYSKGIKLRRNITMGKQPNTQREAFIGESIPEQKQATIPSLHNCALKAHQKCTCWLKPANYSNFGCSKIVRKRERTKRATLLD